MDCYTPGQGLMPASFKVQTVFLDREGVKETEEILQPDFGEAAIGRVAPVDSGELTTIFDIVLSLLQLLVVTNCLIAIDAVGLTGLWWIILLRAYGKCTGDLTLQERVDVQTGIKMILKVCLADGFDMFPSLLVTDGSMMIDRRMGTHGHPLEIQVSFSSYSPLCIKLDMKILNRNWGSFLNLIHVETNLIYLYHAGLVLSRFAMC